VLQASTFTNDGVDLPEIKIGQIYNHDYLDGKKQFHIPDFQKIASEISSKSALQISIEMNDKESVRLLLEETSLSPLDITTDKQETLIHLCCKAGVDIEILELVLIHVKRHLMEEIVKVKEFLALKDSNGVTAYDYCKAKKRSDLAVVLEEFVDSSKSVLNISYTRVEDVSFDSKFSSELSVKLNPKAQYSKVKTIWKVDKGMAKQIRPLEVTPFMWIDSEEGLQTFVEETKREEILAVDLEYHNFEKHTSAICLIQISSMAKDYVIDALVARPWVT